MLASWAAFLRRVGRRLPGSLVLAGGWLATSCSGAHEPAQEHQATPPVRPAATMPAINVPALLGRSIESLRQRLGPGAAVPLVYNDSAIYSHLDAAVTDSVVALRAGRLLLVASYDLRSRRVHDLLVLGHHEDSLMHQAALRPTAPNYLVLPVFRADHPGSLLGLRVVDTAPN